MESRSGEQSGEDEAGLSQLVKKLDRREFIFGAGITGVIGWQALPIPSKVDERLTYAENRFEALSGTIDRVDLKKPTLTGGLATEIRNEITSVESTLHSDSVKDGKTVANTRRELAEAVSAGIKSSSERSRTARRMATLEAAVQYYLRLLAAMEASSSLQRRLSGYETETLYNREELTSSPPGTFRTKPLHSRIKDLPGVERLDNRAVTTRKLNQLLPVLDTVRSELSEQVEILRVFRAAQESYLRSGVEVEVGARAHEQANFDRAKSTFAEAKEAASLV